jgi:hypothetical protein
MNLVEPADRRESGRIVRLLWDPRPNQAVLPYSDRMTGDAFVTDVPNDRALTAFEHPNAFRPLAAAA